MIVIGESYSFSCDAVSALAIGPVQLEGDAPERSFQAIVRNEGPGVLTLHVRESPSAAGTYTYCVNRAGATANLILSPGSEGVFDFVVQGANNWFIVTAISSSKSRSTLKLLSCSSRPPINV